ncbi:MAG: fibronectin type III domain-containing protein, partial [Bacteroidales bacterium]|nr:fibronectin type III domain-containing protein [Bacteroidales bacterium]
MKRRAFIKDTAMLVAAASAGNAMNAAERSFASLRMTDISKTDVIKDTGEGKLIVSAPMLQNYAETSIGVAFAVSDLANGYVLIGEKPDLSDARKVKCGGYRLTELSDKVSQIRVTGLKPSTKYYYKIGADRIHYGGGYDMKILGNEEDPRVYSFITAGPASAAKFCVINDTHVRWNAIEPT